MKKIEQSEPNRGQRRNPYHRHLKTAARRIMRRLGKILFEDAPRRLPRRGYEY